MTVIRADRLREERFERQNRISWLDPESIRSSKVLVVGAGAIGNEVLKDLALSGFEDISIVDMDQIERSNLNRCLFFSESDADQRRMKAEVAAERLKVLSPEGNYPHYQKKIQDMPEDFIPSHDIVLGCLDNIAARLHLNAFCYHNKVPYIDGAIDGFSGKVQVIMPPKTPCLECTMNKTHMKVMDMRFSCTGREVTFFQDKLAAEITTTSVVAAVMVRECMKVLSKKEDMVIKGIFYYSGERNSSDILEIEFNPSCAHHTL